MRSLALLLLSTHVDHDHKMQHSVQKHCVAQWHFNEDRDLDYNQFNNDYILYEASSYSISHA